MTRLSFSLVTFCCLTLTGLVVVKAGWLAVTRNESPSTRRGEPRAQLRAQESTASEAAWRWRRCQPHHWRTCFLQK